MIVLQILKITGLVLLILLGVILILLAIILLVPIHYRADIEYKDDEKRYNVLVRANWILHIIRVRFEKDPDRTDTEAKVLFFKVYPKKEKAGTLGERKAPEESGFSKIKYKITDLYVKIKRIIFMINDERDQAAVRELLLRTKKLLWHLRPRKTDIRVDLGMGDPASTGEVLGIIYALYPVYRDKIHVTPDFDNKELDATALFKGHIILLVVLIALLKVYFDKDIRRLYRQIQKLKEKKEARPAEEDDDTEGAELTE